MILRASRGSVDSKGRHPSTRGRHCRPLAQDGGERKSNHHLFYLFLFALSVRLLYFYQVGKSHFFFPPSGLDPSLYHQWAQSIAQGKGMGNTVFQAMPLYPYFLGLIYKWSAPGLFWAKLLQIFLGVLGVLLVYSIGNTLFGPPRGLLAASGQALSGISIFYEGVLVPVTLIAFLFTAILFLLLRAEKEGRLRDWFGLGILLGVTTFAHAGILLFLPFLLLWVMFFLKMSLLKKWATLGMLLGCVLVALFGIFFRNLWVAHEPVFFTSHGGINFYIGNHPGSTGRFQSLFSRFTGPEQLLQESKEAAEREIGRALTAGEASRFWFRKGWGFIQGDPAGSLTLFFKKLLLFWNGHEIEDVEDYYFFRSRFFVLKYLGIPLAWFIPLGLVGIFVGRQHFRRLFLLYTFFLSQMVAILFMFVNSRYRAPLGFFVILFAASGVSWLWGLFRQKRYGALIGTCFVLLHLVFLTHVDIGRTHEELHDYNRGIALDHAGEHQAAIDIFEKALFLYPKEDFLLFAVGNAYFRKGDLHEARQRYLETLRVQPRHADAYYNLALLDFYKGRLEEAEASLQKSAALKGDRPDVYYLLSVVYRKRGLLQEARAARERALAQGAEPEALDKEPVLDRSVR